MGTCVRVLRRRWSSSDSTLCATLPICLKRWQAAYPTRESCSDFSAKHCCANYGVGIWNERCRSELATRKAQDFAFVIDFHTHTHFRQGLAKLSSSLGGRPLSCLTRGHPVAGVARDGSLSRRRGEPTSSTNKALSVITIPQTAPPLRVSFSASHPVSFLQSPAQLHSRRLPTPVLFLVLQLSPSLTPTLANPMIPIRYLGASSGSAVRVKPASDRRVQV